MPELPGAEARGPRTVGPVLVRFRRAAKGRACAWEAVRPPRTRVPGSTMAAGADVPHDLATFVVEQALGIEHGFWGCVAQGATFRSLGRKRTPQGTEVVRRRRGELDAAERRVNEAYGAWKRGEPTPAADALDEALRRWRALGEDDVLELTWSAPVPRRRGSRP